MFFPAELLLYKIFQNDRPFFWKRKENNKILDSQLIKDWQFSQCKNTLSGEIMKSQIFQVAFLTPYWQCLSPFNCTIVPLNLLHHLLHMQRGEGRWDWLQTGLWVGNSHGERRETLLIRSEKCNLKNLKLSKIIIWSYYSIKSLGCFIKNKNNYFLDFISAF